MRVLPSLPYSCLGLTLLAAFGIAMPARQAKRGQALDRPVHQAEENGAQPTKIVVRPTRFQWSELRRIQESLAMQQMGWAAEQPRQARTKDPLGETLELELPMPDVRGGSSHALPEGQPQGGSESLAACVSFAGIPPASLSTSSQCDASGLLYPANGAGGVGPDHLMTMAANTTLVQDRLGATISSVDTLVFWSPLAPPSVTYCRLDYDGVSGRWIATAKGGTAVGACNILFAISDSDDPTGSWDFYSIPADPTLSPPTFPDGLKMGYNSNWVAVCADMYSSTDAAGSQGSRLYTFEMAAAVAGGPVTATTFPPDFTFTTTGLFNAQVNFRNVPVRSLDTSISDLWIFNSRATSGSNVAWQAMRITGTGAAPSVVPTPGSPFGGNQSLMFLPINYTNVRQAVFQVGDIREIDPLQPDGQAASTRARIDDAVVRNGHVYIVHGSGLPGPNAATPTSNGICFYELDPTLPFAYDGVTGVGPFLQDMQLTDGPNTTCMFPSVAVNCANDVLIGFSRSDATKDIEAAYRMRLGTDPLNTMGPSTTLKAGESSWWQVIPPPGSASLGTWGYYSSAAVDPNDDKTLWTLQPYAATRVGGADEDSRWGTWWGRFGDCEIRPLITDQPEDAVGCVGGLVTFRVEASSTSALTYQWRKDGIEISGANSDRYSIASALPADVGSYDVVVRGCGEALSAMAALSLTGATFLDQPDSLVAMVGDPATFAVAVSSASPVSYRWLLDGHVIPGASSDSYSIPVIASDDFGSYCCVVTGDCGPQLSESAILRQWIGSQDGKTLRGNPSFQILQDPQPLQACEGTSAALEVVAYPRRGLSYLWRKDGVVIPTETRSRLAFSPALAVDAGSYDVLVSRGNDTLVSGQAIVDVSEGPCPLSAIEFSEDAAPVCPNKLTKEEFLGFFEPEPEPESLPKKNGFVKVPNGLEFDDIPNCSFYKWAHQMFLWLTSPAPSGYGVENALVMNSGAFFRVTGPDASFRRQFLSNVGGPPVMLSVEMPRRGPVGLPIVIERGTGDILELVPPVLASSGKPLILDETGVEVEVGGFRFSRGSALLVDAAGIEIRGPRVLLRSKDDAEVRPYVSKYERLQQAGAIGPKDLVQEIDLGGQSIVLDMTGDIRELEQKQAFGEVVMSQNQSLVYYSISANNVFAMYRTKLFHEGNNLTGKMFPVNATELSAIENFSITNERGTLIDKEALAVEIKASWVKASTVDDPSKFILMTAVLPKYTATWQRDGVETATVALVGLHIVGSVHSPVPSPQNLFGGHPEMIWATFEHLGNAPSDTYEFTIKPAQAGNFLTENRDTTGSWTFCTSGASDPFNERHIAMDGSGNIISYNGFPISASNLLRTAPWGLPSDTRNKNAEIVAMNRVVQNNLHPDDVRRNYFHVGSTWTQDGGSPNNVNQKGSTELANTTMETFVQRGSPSPMNCFDCHQSNTIDSSHVFADTDPLFLPE